MKIKTILPILLSLLSIKLAAQDKITFTTQCQGHGSMGQSFMATKDKVYTIDWGDGTPLEIRTGKGDYYDQIDHLYANVGEYTANAIASNDGCRLTGFACSYADIVDLAFSNCSALIELWGEGSAVKNLDVTGCSSLKEIMWTTSKSEDINSTDCIELVQPLKDIAWNGGKLENMNLTGCTELVSLNVGKNKLTHLDFSGCPKLNNIYCSGNQIQLSDLYAIYLFIMEHYSESFSFVFGTQNLPEKTVAVGEELFSDQSVFNGEVTKYTVKIKIGLFEYIFAPESDYSVIDGKITFHNVGDYYVTMTNEAIFSSLDGKIYPASVVVPVNVRNAWIIEKSLNVYPNPTDGEFIIDNGDFYLEIFDTEGKKQYFCQKIISPISQVINISHLPAGIYILRMNDRTAKIIKK